MGKTPTVTGFQGFEIGWLLGSSRAAWVDLSLVISETASRSDEECRSLGFTMGQATGSTSLGMAIKSSFSWPAETRRHSPSISRGLSGIGRTTRRGLE